MKKRELPKNSIEALQLVANNKFNPFDKEDWMAYSGCRTEFPLICYLEAEYAKDEQRDPGHDEFETGMVIILDGEVVYFEIYDEEDESGQTVSTTYILSSIVE